MADSMDPHNRIVQMLPMTTTDSSTEFPTQLRYRHAALIATGARGAPPPGYLIDQHAFPLVLELRPTILPPNAQQIQQKSPSLSVSSSSSSSEEEKEEEQKDAASLVSAIQQRPYLSPAQVRQKVVDRAKQGKNVGILGCGWDALDLAIAASQPTTTSTSSFGMGRKRKNGRACLIYGSAGPVSHVLPNYLFSAVTKRMRAKRIEIMDRTLIRYVSMDDNLRYKRKNTKGGGFSNSNSNAAVGQQLGLYTSKSYDVLDTQRSLVDYLVVAPEINGSRGNAMVPTLHFPAHLIQDTFVSASKDSDTKAGRPWYETWSKLSTPQKLSSESETPTTTNLPTLICHQDDGRVSVNTELCACTGVFAAGSVAKCGNAFSCQTQVTGLGAIDAAAAGQVAAANMSRSYQQSMLSLGTSEDERYPVPTKTHDPFPIWRSDILSYDAEAPSSLSRVGISALCVGHCDSERFATHGVWWTNQAAQKRFIQEFSRQTETFSSTNSSSKDEALSEQLAREQRKLRERAKEEVSKSVYGIGVVYYLDREGRIQGVMCWGLPFSSGSSSTTVGTLKDPLIQRIRNLLLSNTPDAKSYDYYALQSRLLVLAAFSSSKEADQALQDHRLDLSKFPKPLHRLTSPWGILHMRRRGHGAHSKSMNNDIYARHEHGCDFPDPFPPPRPVAGIGFSDKDNPAFKAAEQLYEYQLWEQRDKQWDENEAQSIPNNEDIVWVRKGYEDKNISAKDKNVEMLNQALGRRPSFGGANAHSTQNASYNN